MDRRQLRRWLAAAACAAAVAPWAQAQGDALEELMSRTARHGAPSGTVAPARDAAADVVIAAMNFLDRPYRRGGDSVDSGFDCSGFTRHLFGQTLGIELPRRVDDQAHHGALSPVQRDAMRAGDLVFFNTLRRTFSHVGIYLGDGRFIHAPRSGAQIRVESLSTAYWARRFSGARRAVLPADSNTP
ncbi:MAG TPA: C40 family peptidase [Burkholderiaceae bacterium]|nr:C40 family peptidase [Burkholderiaceae bacterium]